MRAFLILLALLVAAWLLRPHFLARRDRARARRAAREVASRTPAEQRPESVRVIAAPPVPVPPPVTPTVAAPLGTAHLDEPGAVRPELDGRALHQARAAVDDVVPDALLEDALLDATPQDVSRLLSEVPRDVLERAVGGQATAHATPLKADEARQIAAVAEGLDDLDIWSFGDTGGAKA